MTNTSEAATAPQCPVVTIGKEHVLGHRFRAVVYDETGVLFRPWRQNWTRGSRQECYEWCDANGYSYTRNPKDAAR